MRSLNKKNPKSTGVYGKIARGQVGGTKVSL